jgi:RHS repeat-associated protein
MRSHVTTVTVVLAVTLSASIAYAIDGPTPGAISSSKLKLPDGPSSVRGLADAAEVQVASAQVAYSIPIEAPKSAGIAPALAIGYRGDLGNSSLGVGWSLDHAAIRRSTRNGVPHFDDSDEIEISGVANGQLIRITDGTYRVEGAGNSIRAVRSGNRWIITDSDGTIYYFGLTTSSRQEAQVGSQLRTVAWLPEMVVHLSGKFVTYQYVHDKGQVYLAGATWGPLNKYRVEVTYAARPDAVVSYREGFEVTTALRASSIRVTSGGATILRTYQLTYDDSLTLSRLASVTMTGLDGAGALPSITFGYGPQSNGTRAELVGLDGWRLNTRGVSFFDVDGDGMDDLLRLEMGNHEYRKNLGGAFGPEVPLAGATSIELSSAQLLDLDGDARAELVRTVNDSWRGYRIDPAQGQWTAMGEWPGTFGVPFGGPGTVLADLNGDGRTDVIRGGATNLLVNFATKTGMGPTQVLPVISPSDVNVEPGLPTVRFTDINGDGLSDVVWLTDAWMKQFLGRGDGTFVAWRRVFYPWGPGVIDPQNTLLHDLNRDGILDLIRITAGHVAMYPGRPAGSFETARALARPDATDADVVVTVADANGNGSLDVVWSSPRGMWLLDLAGATSAGMLTSIDNGLGQITRFTYQASAILSVEAENAGQTWDKKLPVSIAVPVRTDTLIPGSPTRTVHWGVRDGFWDGEERRFGGFLETRKVLSGPTARETQVTVSRQHGGVGVERVLRGTTILSRVENGLGEILTEATTAWEACRLASLPEHDLLRRAISRSSVTAQHEGVATPLSTVKYTIFDTECRPTEEYDDGRVDLDGDDEKLIRRAYAPDDNTRWIRDRVCRQSTYSGDGQVLLASTQHYFGGPGQGGVASDPCSTVGLGLVRRTEGWLDGESRWVTLTEVEYDSHWNPVKVLADGVWRTFGYDPFGLYLMSEVVDPADVALAYAMTWDQVRDLPTSVVDPSGVDTRVTYDELGRLKTVALGTHNPHLHYVYDWTAPTPSTHEYSFAGEVTATPVFGGAFASGQWRESVAVANGAGEALFGAVRLEPAHWIISGWRERDARGRTVVVASPFDWNNASLASVTVPAPPHPRQTIDYDGFDRVVRQTLPTGAQKTIAYKAFETTTTNDDLAPVTSRLDGQGRIRRTHRVVSGITESVDATYDALDRITAMTLQDGQPDELEHAFVYDTLGRLVFATDPDIGNRNLVYDDGGRLVEYTNGAVQTVAFGYDGAGRLVSRSAAGVSFAYHYDDAYEPSTFLRTEGRLAWVEEPTGRVQLGYDVMGRLAHVRRTVNGQTADEVTSLSATGNAIAIDYQDGVALAMQYDDAGRLVEVEDLWALNEQDPAGRVLRETFGNGIETTYARDPLGQPTDIAVKRGATELYRALNIQRNAYGAITSVTDSDGRGLDHSAAFSYDGGARLTAATIGTGTSQLAFSYVYDGLQNMTSRSGAGNGTLVGEYNYAEPRMMGGPALGPRQLTSITTTTGTVAFDYDAAGRQIQQGPITLEYDGLDQLIRVSGVPSAAGDVVHGYGYDGQRVFTQHPNGDTQVWFTPQLSQTDGDRDHYVRIGGRLIARLKLSWIGESGGASTGGFVTTQPGRLQSILAAIVAATALLLLAFAITRRRLRWRLAPAALACASAFLGCSWFSSKSQAVWEISTTTYYHQGIGAGPTLMTREDATILEERRYEPFGDDLDANREPPGGGMGVTGLIDFLLEPHSIANKPTDPTTGWSYHGARWMVAETGRWLTPDPPTKAPDPKFMTKPWGLHPYQYVEQNPILYWDPDGREDVNIEEQANLVCYGDATCSGGGLTPTGLPNDVEWRKNSTGYWEEHLSSEDAWQSPEEQIVLSHAVASPRLAAQGRSPNQYYRDQEAWGVEALYNPWWQKTAQAFLVAGSLVSPLFGARAGGGFRAAAVIEARAGSLILTDVRRLSASEITTGERLAQRLGRDLSPSAHEGAEFVDALGFSYDAMGGLRASQHWNETQFLRSIDRHLVKSNDFTAIDLTGFTEAQKATVRSYVGSLPSESQTKIIIIE